jgi:hypothetical protein
VKTLDAWGTRFKQYTDSAMQALLQKAGKLKVLECFNQAAIKFESAYFTSHRFRLKGHFNLEKLGAVI